ncbi:hypothetical protein HTVC115P_gp63 [Pelagibacter phage HTVC115P]|nr:hypothetical protein HTVC115P_gp63 [Pelagibacter phage HTVC115P]
MAISKIPMQGFSQQGINFRNFVMNGDMEISQRGTSFAAISNAFCIDRFKFNESTSGACTITQDSSTPDGQGFSKSLKIDITTADTSIANNEYSYLTYKFEGQQCQEWLYGTSSAKTLTLSFWCKSAKTGTYCIGLVKESMSGTRYEYLVEYSISSANTWEKKTITITPTAGSTSFITGSAAAIDSTTASGFRIHWTFVTGSDYQQATSDKWYQTSGTAIGTSNQVNLFDSTSNDFYLTGVQLEIGTTASDFEHLPPEVNEKRCFRYYWIHGNLSTFYAPYASNDAYNTYWNSFPVPMRAAPTITETSSRGWSVANKTRFIFETYRQPQGNYLPPNYTAESEL